MSHQRRNQIQLLRMRAQATDPVEAAIAALQSGDYSTALAIVTKLAGTDTGEVTPEIAARSARLGLSKNAATLCARSGIDPKAFADMRATMRTPAASRAPMGPLETRLAALEANSRKHMTTEREADVARRHGIDPAKFSAKRDEMRRKSA